jgi:predicted nucleic acid-binding protein
VNTIFLDTVGLVALWDRKDAWHSAAKACFSRLDLKTTRLVTTSLILLECANHAARRAYRDEVTRLRDDLILAGDLYELLTDEVSQAWEDYARGTFGTAGVIDLVSFAVMRRLSSTEAFTNDRHFAAAGFKVVL